MSNFITALKNVLNPQGRELSYEISFGHDAAKHGEHGVLVGTWIKNGAKQPITISFFFNGMTHAPKLGPEVLDEIFHHARMQGIEPTHLFSYSSVFSSSQKESNMRFLRSAPQLHAV